MRVMSVLLMALALGSCKSPIAPSRTPTRPDVPDVLFITPTTDALKLAETQALSAVVVSGDGSRRPVSATWSSDAPDVAAVSDDGRVRGISLGTTQIHAAFETMSAVNPLRIVSDYAGSWSGEYHFVGCTKVSGEGPDVCRLFLGNTGVKLPLMVIVNQAGASVTGTLNLFTNNHKLLEAGPIEGIVDMSNALTLSGHTRSVDRTEHSETVIDNWRATLAADGNHLMGNFSLTQTFRNAWGVQKLIEQCELMNVTRS